MQSAVVFSLVLIIFLPSNLSSVLSPTSVMGAQSRIRSTFKAAAIALAAEKAKHGAALIDLRKLAEKMGSDAVRCSSVAILAQYST